MNYRILHQTTEEYPLLMSTALSHIKTDYAGPWGNLSKIQKIETTHWKRNITRKIMTA